MEVIALHSEKPCHDVGSCKKSLAGPIDDCDFARSGHLDWPMVNWLLHHVGASRKSSISLQTRHRKKKGVGWFMVLEFVASSFY